MMQGKFTKHLFSGETSRTETWLEGIEYFMLESRAVGRNDVIIFNAVILKEYCAATSHGMAMSFENLLESLL